MRVAFIMHTVGLSWNQSLRRPRNLVPLSLSLDAIPHGVFRFYVARVPARESRAENRLPARPLTSVINLQSVSLARLRGSCH